MELHTESGTLLAAAPDMLDPNFMHAVVLMCNHTEHGALGLVLNRPAPVTVDVIMPDHPVLSTQKFPVYAGGPVGLDTLQFVHRADEEIPGGLDLGDGLFLGGDLEALARFIAGHGVEAQERVRLIVGYAGWGAGQLEGELAVGAWLPVAPHLDWVFQADTTALWRRVVRSLGGDAAGLEDLPPDVSWN